MFLLNNACRTLTLRLRNKTNNEQMLVFTLRNHFRRFSRCPKRTSLKHKEMHVFTLRNHPNFQNSEPQIEVPDDSDDLRLDPRFSVSVFAQFWTLLRAGDRYFDARFSKKRLAWIRTHARLRRSVYGLEAVVVTTPPTPRLRF